MKGNKYINHFSAAAFNVSRNRSKFGRPNSHATTFNTGKLIPVYTEEVLPGDTLQIDLSAVIRGSTPKFPVMDNAYLDMYAFFVPNRLVMDEWEEFMGENKSDYWSQEKEFLIPHITPRFDVETQRYLHTPVDYIGLLGNLSNKFNFNNSGITYSALYPRAYATIWNEWFRDQNTQEPCMVHKDSIDRSNEASHFSDYVTGAEYGSILLPLNKYHDAWTSALPEPQKHDPITIPIAISAPVYTEKKLELNVRAQDDTITGGISGNTAPLIAYNSQGQEVGQVFYNGSTASYPNVQLGGVTSGNTGPLRIALEAVAPKDTKIGVADLSSSTGITINALRLAEKTQRFYEIQARGGSRYTEIIQSMFGVYAADSRLQRPEFLGGQRLPIKQSQVTQSFGNGEEDLGATGAFSLTSDYQENFINKTFTEHGLVFIVCGVRTDQTYSQGQERRFARRSIMDYYFPVFANRGEVPILNKELFISPDKQYNEEVFGYQEAYFDYRYKPNRVSGLMRPEASNNLSAWNYANNFLTRPVLNGDFIKETEENVKRTIITPNEQQWIADFYFVDYSTRVMPVYSIPSISDRF